MAIISYSPLRATSSTLLEMSVAVIFTSRSLPGRVRRNSSITMATEYGSWPVEQAEDQILNGWSELRSANSGKSFSCRIRNGWLSLNQSVSLVVIASMTTSRKPALPGLFNRSRSSPREFRLFSSRMRRSLLFTRYCLLSPSRMPHASCRNFLKASYSWGGVMSAFIGSLRG